MAAKRATVADAMGRIDGMEGKLDAVLNALGAGETEAKPPSETSTPEPSKAESAKQTRTVRLPDLQTFEDERRGVGVDGTYRENIAIFKLREDGTPVAKRDGGVKKPTRIRVEDAEFILRHPEVIEGLCANIRELQASEQASSAE